MLPPVILSAQITTLAHRWRDECVAQWGKWTHPLRHLVGEEVIVSPEDGKDRKVALYLSTPLPAAAITSLPDAVDKAGVMIAQPGYFSIHIERAAMPSPRMLLTMLLHELTHVVDPLFVTDTLSKKQWQPSWFQDSLRHYALPSEQRAFTAMWIEELRDRYLTAPSPDLTGFVPDMMGLSIQFEGFVNFCPHLHNQIADHLYQIAASVRAELGI